MDSFEKARQLLLPPLDDTEAAQILTQAGFQDWQSAWKIIQRMSKGDEKNRFLLSSILPNLFHFTASLAGADRILVFFDRYVGALEDKPSFYQFLIDQPRALEILVTLFSNSQFLSEILLRSPQYLDWLTEEKNLYQPKKLVAYIDEAANEVNGVADCAMQLARLRHYQRRELLRIGLSDLMGQFDLAAVTRQLSHLADGILIAVLRCLSRQMNLPLLDDGAPAGFAVIAMGKLGGRELNYSSDIDLIFVVDHDDEQFQKLGEKLITAITQMTDEGFLYRVDMRLRPWGRVGRLVPTIAAYINYLNDAAQLWEKQAMLKARLMAGDERVGKALIDQAFQAINQLDADASRAEVLAMKQQTEAFLAQNGRTWGEVKLGQGSIRDIEFIVQYLQLVHGVQQPEIRNRNTLESLRRLMRHNFIPIEEFRLLTEGYTFLRTIEHHLQMMNYRQTCTLPADSLAILDLARRLGYSGVNASTEFVNQYQQYSAAIRTAFLTHLDNLPRHTEEHLSAVPEVQTHIDRMDPSYETMFSRADIRRHARMAQELDEATLAKVDAVKLEDDAWRVTIVASDFPGELSLICGLMFVHGLNIEDGDVYTYEPPNTADALQASQRKIVDVFTVRHPTKKITQETWRKYTADLVYFLHQMHAGNTQLALIELVKRAAATFQGKKWRQTPLYPIEISIDNTSSKKYTILRIKARDTIGFLYEFTNALAFNHIYIARMEIETYEDSINDILYITNAQGGKIENPDRQRELRAAAVLIKHFTHLLPQSPDPESALLHFREFIAQLFQQENWMDELASLEKPDVMQALARLLGVSDFLWYDFLRMQYTNLFPVVQDVDALHTSKTRLQLQKELEDALRPVHNGAQPPSDDAPWTRILNEFKDREMFRIDMRHILGHTREFWEFSNELTDLTEVIVNNAYHLCAEDLRSVYGLPRLDNGEVAMMSICALGKCGGREMGFASDIELMFIYSGNGKTDGPRVITTSEFFEKVVENFVRAIYAKREGIFQVDLQLRPYGKAGSLAVSVESFRRYYSPGGAAWPYERQALVRLRPIAGDQTLGAYVANLRDEYLYNGEPFDVVAMRAMRERQLRHLVKAGEFHPKYSPGGLVDIEYLIQGLQIQHGAADPTLRCTNTRDGIKALTEAAIIPAGDYQPLKKAHTFFRWLIDSMRVVEGNAQDLLMPAEHTEAFAYLARRLRYGDDVKALHADLDKYSTYVQEVNLRLFGR